MSGAARVRLALAGVLLTGIAHGQSPSAQSPPAPPPAPISTATPQQAARCAGLQDDGVRLACYDALFRATPEAVAAGFGLERRELRAAETIETIDSPITNLERLRDGTVRVTLENGQVWRQTDGTPQTLWRTGDRLVVERAALGSFLAAVEGSGRRVRVRRER